VVESGRGRADDGRRHDRTGPDLAGVPVRLRGTSSDWALLARSLLVLAFAGATIGIVVQIATLLRRRVDNTAPH
jgi:hypothetical protein